MRYPLILLLLTAMLRMPCAAQTPPVTAEELVSVLRLHKERLYSHYDYQMSYHLGGVPDSLAGRLVIPEAANIILTAVRQGARGAHMTVHMRVAGDPEAAAAQAYAALVAAGGAFKPERQYAEPDRDSGFVTGRTHTQPETYCSLNREPVVFHATPEMPEANLTGYVALGDPQYLCRPRPRMSLLPTRAQLEQEGASEAIIKSMMRNQRDRDRMPDLRLVIPDSLIGQSAGTWTSTGTGGESNYWWTSEPLAYADSPMEAATLHGQFVAQVEEQGWARVQGGSTGLREHATSKWSYMDAEGSRWHADLMVERVGRLEDDLIEYRATLTIAGTQAGEEQP